MMSTVVSSPVASSPGSISPPALYKFSVEQYHDMIRKGILKSGEPFELIEGILVKKMTVNLPHIHATHRLMDLFVRGLPISYVVFVQSPVTTPDSEPEPDIAVVRGDRSQFLAQGRKPGPEDTELLIEVAESSLAFDRTTKLGIYARAGIREYWIVDVINQRVAVYTGPTGPGSAPTYQHRTDFVPGQEIPVMLDGREAIRGKVAELFL